MLRLISREPRNRRPRNRRKPSLVPSVHEEEGNESLLPEGAGKAADAVVYDDASAAEKPPIDDENLKKKPFYQRWGRKFTKSVVELLGEDWLYLVLLGVLMGVFSFAIDIGIAKLRFLHFYLFRATEDIHWTLQYTSWVMFSLVLILASVVLCHFLAPHAGGSGIPELKTILRGVALKEYLTLRTLLTKFIGLVMALGSGLPFGKEGPFVHIASMLSRLLSKMVFSFQSIYENESRSSEMLAAAAAVGVASTYGAAVGGVLFSIEVTSVFFPLRNYWRGFLATVSSAVIFRLLAVWSHEEQTVVAFSATSFPSDYPFDPKELIVFVFIGIICGFLGAFFVWFHRKYVELVLQNTHVKAILKKNFLIYPAIVTFVIASLKCPLGYGQFFDGGRTPREVLGNLFSNFSWNDPGVNNTQAEELFAFWAKGTSSIFVVLALYALNMGELPSTGIPFWMTAIAITLPVPCGVFIPIFVSGAAFGRLIGETMYTLFPNGVRTDGVLTKIVPGAYALVGATAFSGAVTHALSVSVIVVEITGQITHILPIMLAVLLANAVCARLQPSIYDSIIRLKKLPYLPRILPTSSSVHKIYAGDLCVRDVKFISLSSTYREVQDVLVAMPKLKSLPLVDRPSSAILLGSVRRSQIEKLLEEQVGEHARYAEAERRRRQQPADRQTSRIDNPDEIENAFPVNIPERRGSRFQVRRVRSHEALKNYYTPVHRKQSCGQQNELAAVATVKMDSQSAKVPAAVYHQQQETSRSQPATLHAATTKIRETVNAVGNYVNSLPQKLRMSLRRGLPTVHHYQCDLSVAERKEWETQQLDQRLDFDKITIDPAPFQLVERTSLYKVHSLFWLLGLNRAYVTCLGRLVGVVALRELRQTLEKAQPCNQKETGRRRATFDSIRLPWRTPFQKFTMRAWRKPSFRGRLASVAPSFSLIPGQSEAINVSLPSTPGTSRRVGRSDNGDCLSTDDDEESERSEVEDQTAGASCYDSAVDQSDSEDDGDKTDGKRDSYFSAV